MRLAREGERLAENNLSVCETIAMLPGGWDLAHPIRLGIKAFAELGANSEALSGSQIDSPCSCRAIFQSAPVAMLQSRVCGYFSAVFSSQHLSLSGQYFGAGLCGHIV